jgi:hypothetical protein
MSEIDDRMAVSRKRLALMRALTDRERMELLAYVNHRAELISGSFADFVDEWLWDREADSAGTRYDAWGHALTYLLGNDELGRAFIVLIGVAFAVFVVLITLNPGGSLW